jgi:ankyrin repeat protein
MDEACATGNLELVKKLGQPKDGWAIALASSSGNLELVKYLVSINAPIDIYAIPKAAYNGHLDIIKYLVSINSPVHSEAIYNATFSSHWNIVKYLLWIGVQPYELTSGIKKMKKKIYLEFEPIVSEIAGPDIGGLILQNLI